jgi:hypothetical protein
MQINYRNLITDIIVGIIKEKKLLNSSKGIVWEIIADVDKDPNYWYGIRQTRNTRVNGNTIERETIISFRHSKCQEVITLEPLNTVSTRIINGPIIGTKLVKLQEISEHQCLLEVIWDVKARGIAGLFNFIIKKHISSGTRRAIERIANEAEQRNSKLNKS